MGVVLVMGCRVLRLGPWTGVALVGCRVLRLSPLVPEEPLGVAPIPRELKAEEEGGSAGAEWRWRFLPWGKESNGRVGTEC